MNEAVLAAPGAPWWLLVNYDIAFTPSGVLGRIAAAVEKRLPSLLASVSASKPQPFALHTFTFEYGATNTWSNFAITRQAVAEVGLFDENFYPAYWEDGDYALRASKVLGDRSILKLESSAFAVVHGKQGATVYQSGSHETLRRQGAARPAEKASWMAQRLAGDNGAYMMAKHHQTESGSRKCDWTTSGGTPGQENVNLIGPAWAGRLVDPSNISSIRSMHEVDISSWYFDAVRRRCLETKGLEATQVKGMSIAMTYLLEKAYRLLSYFALGETTGEQTGSDGSPAVGACLPKRVQGRCSPL
jgi:hypothetical protein